SSCGVSPDDLVVEDTPKGEWLFYRGVEVGQKTTDLIPTLFKTVMDKLPIAKRMRWGDRTDSFMRPVVSLVMLWNDDVIDTELFGVKSSRTTIGHRFHGEKTVDIADVMSYEQTLASSYVVADIDTRKEMIIEQVTHLVSEIATDGENNAVAVINDDVLDEVNALVEYPVAILGQFNPRYLHIPQEVLIKTMQDNQKYFAVVDDNDEILPYFVTVSNIESNNPEVVRVGNQRVIEPRFADAEFFWENDKKKSLESRREDLKKVVYQEKLGSVYDRSERIAKIANFIADLSGLNDSNAIRAAQLAKCDLVSEMVFEFGELQGVIGEYYAKNDGENDEVAAAIREHYLPKFAGDNLPETDTGLVVSLADKIENIVGGFAVGAKPTGTKDPYALRRASLGVIRLLNETKLDLPLEVLLDYAVEAFNSVTDVDAVSQVDEIKTYITERLKGY
ncbi:MAG: glycine--tRNA ligase subunit beta, partial [Gammaproteobacteria bacterium]